PIPLQDLQPYYGRLRPCAPHRYSDPRGGWPLGLLSWQRDDRFLRSLSEPVSCSRRLHAGRRLGNKQAPPNPCSQDRSPNPGFDVAIYVTTRHQRFTHVRLHETYLTGWSPPFPATFTTRALYPRSLWWFEVYPCRPSSENLPPSLIKLTCSTAKQVSTAHDFLIFDRQPKPLDKDIIVTPRAFAVHADGDAAFEKHTGELGAGELAALIRVEDFRLAMFRQSLLQRLDAELGLHGDRYPMAEHPAAEPIDHGDEIDKAVRQGEWSKKRISASPPRTVRAPFSAYGSPFKPGPWPLRHPDIVR